MQEMDEQAFHFDLLGENLLDDFINEEFPEEVIDENQEKQLIQPPQPVSLQAIKSVKSDVSSFQKLEPTRSMAEVLKEIMNESDGEDENS